MLTINSLFTINLIVHYSLLIITVWSIVMPKKRIWPPPSSKSWQYYVYWGLFYIGIGLDVLMLFLSWNTWLIPAEIRYYIGLPLSLVGSLFSIWAIATLGIKNTYGLKEGFVAIKPYKITRNPQYVGDIVLLFGLILWSNSLLLTIIFLLTILIFILMPFSEELWLEEKYGEQYLAYKQKHSRFL